MAEVVHRVMELACILRTAYFAAFEIRWKRRVRSFAELDTEFGYYPDERVVKILDQTVATIVNSCTYV